MLTEQLIVEKLRTVKPLLTKQFHVSEIGYFGSYAKGNATDKSDLDILIEFSEPVGWDFFRVQDILEETLGIKIDLVTKRALRPQWREKVLQQLKYV
jgi:predicted nucleotidyltransferase